MRGMLLCARALLVILVCLGSCYQPDPPDGLPCSETGQCPEGQTCSPSGRCLASPGDEDIDAGVRPCDDAGSCQEHDCSDGVDNDDNGQIDCADAQCASDPACLEAGQCDDGSDNDGDAFIDCEDADCVNDPACLPACVLADLGMVTGGEIATGNNEGASDQFSAEDCFSEDGGKDVAYLWTAPGDGCYQFDTIGSEYDTVLMVYDTCLGPELDCDDDIDGNNERSMLLYQLSAGQQVVIVIDAYDPVDDGDYALNITLDGPTCPPAI